MAIGICALLAGAHRTIPAAIGAAAAYLAESQAAIHVQLALM
jgi:hypothetical protein